MHQADIQLLEFGYQPKLNRSLGLWQLTAFGLNYLQPIGPAVIFGYLMLLSGGSVPLPYFLAFLGMIFTAYSYSTLVIKYPLSGSIFNYISNISNPYLGFIAGWVIMLDYILVPVITVVCASLSAHQLIPVIPYQICLVTFTTWMCVINIRGIRLTSTVCFFALLFGFVIVIGSFIIWSYAAVSNGHGIQALISSQPFRTGSVTGLLSATSLAIFGYLGFDAITTLAEEAINPSKDIPKAMFICLTIGCLTAVVTGYLATLLIPDWQNLFIEHKWVNATLFQLVEIHGGKFYATIYTIGFILAMVITNIVGTAAGARLLFAMGRDKLLPSGIFTAIHTKWKTPYMNIIWMSGLCLLLGSFINQEQIAELVNYGAVFGFMLLNLHTAWLGLKEKSYLTIIMASLGFLTMLLIFIYMKNLTLVVGTTWLIIGIIFLVLRYRLVRIAQYFSSSDSSPIISQS